MVERITADMPEEVTRGHRFRYHLAAGFLSPGCLVLDAACGTGYGYDILTKLYGIDYLGVDKDPPAPQRGRFTTLGVDLETWSPPWDPDIFIGFETIEHLDNYDAYLDAARRAKQWTIMSVPIVPTVGINPWHKHDFQRGQLIDLFLDRNWRLFQAIDQPSEMSKIYVFQRI